MRWPKPPDHSKHSLTAPDAFYQEMSNDLFRLKEMENDIRNQKKHADLSSLLLQRLMKRRKFVADAAFWRELYFRNTWQYPFLDNVVGVPFVNVTKHNHALSWYMRIFARYPQLAELPIVHLDSHDDSNPIDGADRLSGLYKKYIETSKESFVDAAQEIAYDIGAAMSSILYTTGIRPFVWVMPEWLPDIDFQGEYGEYHHKSNTDIGIQVRSSIDAKRLKNLPWKHYKKIPLVISQYQQVHDPAVKQRDSVSFFTFLKEYRSIVLDIDLDYFCCNGDPDSDEPGEDISSPNRVRFMEMIDRPRHVFGQESSEFKTYSKLVDREMKLIDDRISRFRTFLKMIKKQRINIALISISDSTGLDFTSCQDCASITNHYVSSHVALYIRTKVMQSISTVLKPN